VRAKTSDSARGIVDTPLPRPPDVHDNGVQKPASKIVYWPAYGGDKYDATRRASAIRTVTFAIRSNRAGSETFLNQISQAVWSVNQSLPVASVQTMQEVYDRSLARTSFTLVMLGIAGAMALMLGVIGIYGVIAYAVSQKRREIGIRLALGAQQTEVRRMLVGQRLAPRGDGRGHRSGGGDRADASDEVAAVRNQPARSRNLCRRAAGIGRRGNSCGCRRRVARMQACGKRNGPTPSLSTQTGYRRAVRRLSCCQ
jgi:hypothetical protein